MIGGSIDLGHSAIADLRNDLVRTNAFTDVVHGCLSAKAQWVAVDTARLALPSPGLGSR